MLLFYTRNDNRLSYFQGKKTFLSKWRKNKGYLRKHQPIVLHLVLDFIEQRILGDEHQTKQVSAILGILYQK